LQVACNTTDQLDANLLRIFEADTWPAAGSIDEFDAGGLQA
jgi:hypothetical protein